MPDHVREALLGTEREADPDFQVEEENWQSLIVFLSCQTQWNRDFAGMDATLVWKGLNYPSVETVIRMEGHKGEKAKEIFRDIQVMEAAALPILNKPPKEK